MSKVCTICGDNNRLKMEREFIQGKSVNEISEKYGVSYAALNNHVKNHLSYQLTSQWEKKLSQQNSDLLNELEDILTKAKDIFTRNYDRGRDRLALESLNSQRNTIQLLAQIVVKMHETKALEAEQQAEVEEKPGDRFWNKVERNLNPIEAELFKQLFMKVNLGEKTTYVTKDKQVQNVFTTQPESRTEQTKTFKRKKKKRTKVNDYTIEDEENQMSEDESACEEDEHKVRPVESKEIGYTRFLDHPDVRRD